MSRIYDDYRDRRVSNGEPVVPQNAQVRLVENRSSTNPSTMRREVTQYGALRREQIEARLEEAEGITGSGVAGALRGGGASRAEISEHAVRNSGTVTIAEEPGYRSSDGRTFRERVAADLNRIAPGTTVDANGVVSRAQTRVSGHAQGYRLVDQLLNNPNPVTIGYEANNAYAQPLGWDGVGSVSNPGTGIGTDVRYDPDAGIRLPVRNAQGAVEHLSAPPADSAVILAHELVHASHNQRGTSDPRVGVDENFPQQPQSNNPAATNAQNPKPPERLREFLNDDWSSRSVTDQHFVRDDKSFFRERHSSDVAVREEWRTVGFGGYRQSNEPTENSIRAEIDNGSTRASYMNKEYPGHPGLTDYVPSSRAEAFTTNAGMRMRNAATITVDGVRNSSGGALMGGGIAATQNVYQQWRSGQPIDVGAVASQTAIGVGTGVADEVIQRTVSGAPSVTAGATNSTMRLAASQLRGAGVAGAVTNSAFAIYDQREALMNPETRSQAVGVVAGEAAVGVAAGMAGAYAGAVVGSFIPIPVVGTVAGAAVGFAAGMAVDWAARQLGANQVVAQATTAVIDGISSGVETAKNAVGDFASGVGNRLSSLFG